MTCSSTSAVASSQVWTGSYHLPPTPSIRHALWWHCKSEPGTKSAVEAHSLKRGTRFVVFKVARSGSTWLDATLERALPDTQITFEPYGRSACHHQADQTAEEACLHQLFTRRCAAPNGSDPIREGAEAFCSPCRHCSHDRVASAGLLLNARFVDRARWSQVVYASAAETNVRIVNLRRTNLVRLAVSKFDHGGLAPLCARACLERNGSLYTVHDSAAFVAALSMYAIADQEYGSALAYSWPANVPKHLLLYEDLTSDRGRAHSRLFAFLGISASSRAAMSAAAETNPRLPSKLRLRAPLGIGVCVISIAGERPVTPLSD